MIYFISDLHLSAENPQLTAVFLQFLEQLPKQVTALYILGDLFAAWCGDDIAEDWQLAIAEQLARAARTRQMQIYYLAGNRDFLLGADFAAKCKMQIIADPSLIMLSDQPTVLLHGDSLCTKDVKYQRFKRLVRHPISRWLMLHLPQRWRHSIVKHVTKASNNSTKYKDIETMDADLIAVTQLLVQHHAKLMIHGHTHHPQIHKISLADGVALRLVLGDWHLTGAKVVRYADGSLELIQYAPAV